MEYFQKALDFLMANKVMFATVASIMIGLAKAISNKDAGPFIAKLQAFVDLGAKFVSGIGSILKFVSDFLASLIKSDGFLGKK